MADDLVERVVDQGDAVTAAAAIVVVQAAVLVVYIAVVVWLIVRSRRRQVTAVEVVAAVGVPAVAVAGQAVLLALVDGLVGMRVAALLSWLVAAPTAAALLAVARTTPRH